MAGPPFMESNTLIPHLFRQEFGKITAVLCKTYGLGSMQVAEDLVSETFLIATETWGLKGIPTHPTAWLYAVAKNKTKDYLKRKILFSQKIEPELSRDYHEDESAEIDFSEANIQDSQLRMIFAICTPELAVEAQIALALRILGGFGIDEIAKAFLTRKETINKRLYRAKAKIREQGIPMEFPSAEDLPDRLESVLSVIYLLFNEGYYSTSNPVETRKELCLEALRLAWFLIQYPPTCQPQVQALAALMCFHSSRFAARITPEGQQMLYYEQDRQLWDADLIRKGEEFLNASARGEQLSKYHLEAAISYWHSRKEDNEEKWERILQLYNQLLQIEYSPITALNRTYALSRANGKIEAIEAAKKLKLDSNHLFHSLLGELYDGVEPELSVQHYHQALALCPSESERDVLLRKLGR